MDVRCEKCQTVYEFEDAKVTAAGVTVKCTQCGNLFKVRRRSTASAPEIGAEIGPRPEAPPRRTTSTGMPILPSTASGGVNPATASAASPATAPRLARPTPIGDPASAGRRLSPSLGSPITTGARPPDERTWLVRGVGNGEVKRFRELTTLQQWIVEKKVVRDDEISRSGETWKRLGSIAELSSFFLVVDQAAARIDERVAHDPAIRTAAPPSPSELLAGPQYHGADPSIPQVGPGAPTMGYPLAPARDAPPWASGPSLTFPLTPSATDQQTESESDADDDDLDVPPRSLTRSTLAVACAGLLILGGGAYLGAYKRDAVRHLLHPDEERGRAAYQQGRDLFLRDDEDSLRLSEQEFQRAHGADEASAGSVAALAEVNAVWGGYLRDDARAADAAHQPARAEDQRKRAQARLDDAKRYATEAIALAPDDGEVNRAMATVLIAGGAPAVQIEAYLRRSEARLPDDAGDACERGALALREGRLDEARTRLEQATRLQQAKTQHDLPRAQYLLGEIAVAQGRLSDARDALHGLLSINSNHSRALALLARIEAAPTDGGAAAITPPRELAAPVVAPLVTAVAAPAGTPAAPPVAPAKTPAVDPRPLVSTDGKKPTEPHGFEGLLSQGNKLLERGKSHDAQKLFEKALLEQPENIEALSGMAYCYLDTEHYGAAVDTFKRILATLPNNGEAIIGLAEAYKMRGDKAHSLDYYKRYLADLPSGSKAAMARTNIADLEAALRQSGGGAGGEATPQPSSGGDNKPVNEPPP